MKYMPVSVAVSPWTTCVAGCPTNLSETLPWKLIVCSLVGDYLHTQILISVGEFSSPRVSDF